MGKTSGSDQLNNAANDPFATSSTPLAKVQKCKRGKTLLKAHLLRIDNDHAIPNETVTATKGKSALNKTSAAVTGLADYGEVDPGTYTFTVTLSVDARKIYKPFDPRSASVPKQVDFLATLKIEPRAKLRIVLFDKEGNKISGAQWEITQPVKQKGTTGGDGLIDVEVPWNSAAGDLTAKLPDIPQKEPAPGPAPVVDPANPAYPLGIDAAQFLPKEDKVETPRDASWTYEIDLIGNADDEDGWKARLQNIGFPVTKSSRRLRRSVRAFQRMQKREYAGSGKIGDVSGDLKTLHDTV